MGGVTRGDIQARSLLARSKRRYGVGCPDPETGSGAISVSAALVADLFNKQDEQVRKDVLRELKKLADEKKG